MGSNIDLVSLVVDIGQKMTSQRMLLACAESCTGGGVAQAITAVTGSSAWFERGFVTYSNQAKIEMLGVDKDVIETHGAVSETSVRAMAEGAVANSHAHLALAVTGIAGPDGGSDEKPVGTVWFAWAGQQRETLAQVSRLNGDRAAVREQSVILALQGLLKFIES